MAVKSLQYPAAGEPARAFLHDAEFCVWADDDQDHIGAPDAAAVSVLDGAHGAVGGRCGANECAEAGAAADYEFERGVVVFVGVFRVCGGCVFSMGVVGDQLDLRIPWD